MLYPIPIEKRASKHKFHIQTICLPNQCADIFVNSGGMSRINNSFLNVPENKTTSIAEGKMFGWISEKNIQIKGNIQP